MKHRFDLDKLSKSEIVSLLETNLVELQHLKSENTLLQNVLALIPGNVFWKDTEGSFLGCNNNVASTLGYPSPADVIGKKNSNLFAKELAQLADQVDQQVVTTEQELYLEEPGLNAYKEPAIYLTKKLPLYDQNKAVIGILGVSFDITDRKKMEEDLKLAKETAEATSKAKSEFVANMSHDVKTPLSGIIGLAELLMYRLKRPENLEFAETILTSGQQLLNFFDNCLEVFKLDTTDIVIVKEEFNLKQLVNHLLDLYQPALRSKSLSLTLDYADSVPEFVKGSRTGVYRVLLNLIGNAVKFTNKGSITIKVNLSSEPNGKDINIHFSIIDTGLGIPKDKQTIIFDRFTRLTPSYKGTYEGSGIGLYIVKKYIESMQGCITVESEEGIGSTFHVNIPLEIGCQPVQVAPQTKVQADFSNQHARVLLVEDNLTAQMIESSLLTSIHCEVQIAESGEKALELFEPGKYDLILMDIGLPGLQGDAVAKLIRKMENGTHFHTAIIALTAHVTQEMKQEFSFSGIEDIFSKPLSLDHAREIVQKYYLDKRE